LDIDAVVRDATQDGCAVYVLPGHAVIDRESVFKAIRASCPLDPPLHGNRNWDALSDSLWNGLYELEQDCILIVWPDADALRRAAPDEHQVALEVLADIAETLADPKFTGGKPKRVKIVLGGARRDP
jgi:hypothetical protein